MSDDGIMDRLREGLREHHQFYGQKPEVLYVNPAMFKALIKLQPKPGDLLGIFQSESFTVLGIQPRLRHMVPEFVFMKATPHDEALNAMENMEAKLFYRMAMDHE